MQLSIRYKTASDVMLRTYTGNTKVRRHDPEMHYMVATPPDTSYIPNWDDVLDTWEQLWRTGQLNGVPIEIATLQKGGKWNGKVMISASNAEVPQWSKKSPKNTPLHELLGEFFVGKHLSETTPQALVDDINLEMPDESSTVQPPEAEPQESVEQIEMAGSLPLSEADDESHSQGTVGTPIVGAVTSENITELIPEVQQPVLEYDA